MEHLAARLAAAIIRRMYGTPDYYYSDPEVDPFYRRLEKFVTEHNTGRNSSANIYFFAVRDLIQEELVKAKPVDPNKFVITD